MYLEVDMEDVEINVGETVPNGYWIMFESSGQSIVFQFDDLVKREAFLQKVKRLAT